jgi:hypothetical protein
MTGANLGRARRPAKRHPIKRFLVISRRVPFVHQLSESERRSTVTLVPEADSADVCHRLAHGGNSC